MASQGAAFKVQHDVEESAAFQQESPAENSDFQQTLWEATNDLVKLETEIVPGRSVQQCYVANKDKIPGQPIQASPPLSILKVPTTPQVRTSPSITTPPGTPCRGSDSTPLLGALHRGSLKDVKSALEQEPDAAFFPFPECRFEPALCCSVRFGCSEQIVQLLLQHAARVDAEDAGGRTPLMLLSLQPSNFMPCCFDLEEDAGCSKRQWSLNVAKLLIEAEADPLSSDCGVPSCVQLAAQAQNSHLVRLYRGETDVDAHADNGEQRAFPQFVHW
eukprot:TRINITY_DN12945_c0_g2_i1.p1 TRINITY_DN12945_c0_g2~~TRINITY_DN12945_c0_g2_i1.p1  ORF type:complete len:288 (+),score=58.00 TRINITY_DN12945_c0_g2_i1:43-864(+)